MKTFLCSISSLAATLFVFLFFSCCSAPISSDSTAHTTPQKVLKVGICADSPPLIFKDKGQIVGLEADFAQQLGTFLGQKTTFVEMKWDKLIPALEDGKIDIIMSGMSITEKRAYRVNFSTPYLRSGQILLVRSQDRGNFSNGIYSLMGSNRPFGVIENTTGDFFITKTINKPDLTRYGTIEAAISALTSGKIDAIVHDAPILCYYAAMNEGQLSPILLMATEEYLAWAVGKNTPDLLENANAFLQQQDGNKELEKTLHHWLPYL